MRYPGGKGKVFQRIINLMPEHETYIEAFVGGGAVIRHKKPAAKNFAIDSDKEVIDKLSDLRISTIQLVHTDAFSFLESFPYRGTELVYCDPPYLPETRRRSRVYKNDLSNEQHRKLLSLLKKLPCKVLISGYSSELYVKELAGWNCETFPAKTHTDVRVECVWYNFESPKHLHDCSFFGSSYRERQSIKRRQSRLREKILRMSPIERNALIDWLDCEFPSRSAHHGADSVL